MNEVKQAINGYTKPLEKLLAVIKADALAEKALDVVAICKQVEELTGIIMTTLVPLGNKEYQALVDAHPTEKQWPILSGDAIISKYGPRGTWIYSADLIKEETALKAKQKAEQESGTAKKITPKPDPASSALYAITLKQMPLAPREAKHAKG